MAKKMKGPKSETSDMNKVFTRRQWLKRIRHFVKQELKRDRTLLNGEEVTENGSEKKASKKKTSFGELDPRQSTK